jgi:hypothetical protein
VKDGSVSVRERDQTLAALRQAQAAVRQTQAGQEIARQDIRTVDVGQGGLEAQVKAAQAQLQLAVDFELPALLHVRRAHAASIATLKRYRPGRGGIVHAFSGSLEEAREYLKLGFRLGLGGAATWPQARRLRRLVAQLPEEAIVLQNLYTLNGRSRTELVHNKQKLYELGGTLPDAHAKWDKKLAAEERGNQRH